MRALAIIAALALAGCSDPAGARQAVEAYGLTDVQPGGYAPFGCSDRDTVHTTFAATNVRGQRVEGIVCGDFGPFGKASTVRITRIITADNGMKLER